MFESELCFAGELRKIILICILEWMMIITDILLQFVNLYYDL